MTEKLYYKDAYLHEFAANVTKRGCEADGQPYVVLDKTAFYPTGGGQPCDLGTIGGVEVVDVELVDEEIRHRLASPLPEEAIAVACALDWQRRFDLMQQHTGQHILSAAFDDLLDAPTFSFHLGKETVTIDIKISEVTQQMVDQVEQLANRIVRENRQITARFVDPDELAAMPLRKQPTVTEDVRIVAIDQFDYNPCGGTHPKGTAEVGMIKVLGWERIKGSTRIEFICGQRALAALGEKTRLLRQLTQQLACQEALLPEQVGRLLGVQKELEHALYEQNIKLLGYEAQELSTEAIALHQYRIVSKAFEQRSMQDLQRLAQQIAALHPDNIAFLASSGAKTQLVFARGANVQAMMNSVLKETLALIEGKGGGNPNLAQGGGVGGKPVEELLAHAVHTLQNSL